MRKLRRLPWRIPKTHHAQPAAAATTTTCPRVDPEREARRESWRDTLNAQPVAFAGGRYVYGEAQQVSRPAEIRRKARPRTILPASVAG